jgi:hypothetical protein
MGMGLRPKREMLRKGKDKVSNCIECYLQERWEMRKKKNSCININ